jgi:branched-subunit amino acid transport protein
MTKNQRIAILIMGSAWPLVGLGYMALQFGYLPTGLSLFAQVLGLFLAGTISGAIYLTVRRVFEKSLGAGLINIGYLLFAPVAIMTALVAPGLVEEAGSPVAFVLVTPIMIALYANAAMGAGLGMTGSLAIVARILVDRNRPASEQAAETVNYQN